MWQERLELEAAIGRAIQRLRRQARRKERNRLWREIATALRQHLDEEAGSGCSSSSICQ
jgi:hypothetical protein